MLSRSSSNAAERLRRAKSNTSVHTNASGHQRLPTTTDPFVLRRQAETAAIEAYSRAHQQDQEALALVSRPKPNRRRNQNTGRSEGRHFADARKRSIQNEATKSPMQSHHSSPAHSRSVGDEETIFTRRRSIIPAAVHTVDLAHSPGAPPRRKRASVYADGSPAPRYSQLDEPVSTLHTETDGYAGNLAHLSDFCQGGAAQNLIHAERAPARVIEINDFQPLQPKRIRQRKSFLGSFQKRTGGYNMALPPFNHADSDTAPPNVGLSLAAFPRSGGIEQRKPRNFSDTLKGRLKKVFRKASKMSMPVQHVHAKNFHFSVRDHDVSEASFPDYTDPFMTVAAEEPKPPEQLKASSAQSATNTTQGSSSRSRVTSWANSTLAMSSIRTSNGPFAIPGAHPEPDMVVTEMHEAETSTQIKDPCGLKRSDSNATLRKASSFFGRPIRDKLRRSSKADLRGSGENQGLYSALQSRIKISRSTETANESTISAPLESTILHGQSESSGLATLPSQRYSTSTALSSSISSQGRHKALSAGLHSRNPFASTIRPVTPDLTPVPEAASAGADRTVIHLEVESPAERSPKSTLRRSHAVKAPPLSKEQLLERKERAEQRWTTALASSGLGLQAIDNPYKLPSLSQGYYAQPSHEDPQHVSRADVISPSLYSRATDGESPRPDTPDDIGMTTITITGHEVRKYDISPPKHAHRHHSSRDWRRWLSNEMNSLGYDEQYSRPASGASMNGRYPIINRSCNSSQQSMSRRPDDGVHSMIRGRNTSIESAMHANIVAPATRNRTLSKPKSVADIESAVHLGTIQTSDPCTTRTGLSVTSVKAFNRPKSAFELRVNYKNNAADRAKPLEVRRKVAEPGTLEDHTMLNIYAGPYATGGDFEHHRPAELEGSGIPAMSSSEWLGSTGKGGRKGSFKITPTKSSPRRSPGQRMVTSWLGEKSKENVAAFV